MDGELEIEENMSERAVVIVDRRKVQMGKGDWKGKENIWFKIEYRKVGVVIHI
jgi:hypothetical protein